MPQTGWKVYLTKRSRALGAIGFASGLPNTLLTDAIGAWLSSLGVKPGEIGLTALLKLPLSLKVLWSPAIDAVTPAGFGALDRRRAWILAMQIALVVGIGLLAMLGPRSAGDGMQTIFVLGAVIACCSATLDMAADAYRTDVTPAKERTAAAAVFVAGYRVGMVLAGAMTLWFAGRVGWGWSIGMCAGLMAASIAGTLFAPRGSGGNTHTTLEGAVVEPLAALHRRHGLILWPILLVAIVFKLPDQLGNQMTMPFLLNGMGFTNDEVSMIRQLMGVIITIAGSLTGGAIALRLGLFRSLLVFGVAQAVSNLGFWALAATGKSITLFVAVVAAENFCAGMVGAGFVAFLMSCCERRHAATQYALLTALMSAAGATLPALSGMLVEKVGYGNFFLVSIAAGIPGIVLVVVLRRSLIAMDVTVPEAGEVV